ncbi:unnamed protein product, partial [Rotaria sp. Silwood1]
MTYIDHVIRDTYIETSSELLDIGKFLCLLINNIKSIVIIILFSKSKESYEVYTMGENTNGNLGHTQ